jgi:hypothetical protein
MNPSAGPRVTASPRGLTAFGVFLLFGAVIAFLAGMSLGWRGTAIDRIWVLNSRAYKELAPYGKTIGIPFLLLGIMLAIAGVCWLNRRVWGWRFAVAIIATQVLGDFVNALRGDLVRGLVGFLIASALLVYLLNARVRAAFA